MNEGREKYIRSHFTQEPILLETLLSFYSRNKSCFRNNQTSFSHDCIDGSIVPAREDINHSFVMVEYVFI